MSEDDCTSANFKLVLADDNKEVNWCISTYDNKTKKLSDESSGLGLESFAAGFGEDKIQFGVIKVVGVDDRESVTSKRPKYVRINWVGPHVKAMHKMGALAGRRDAESAFQGVAVTMNAESKDDFEMMSIANELLKCGGAHKPTYYDFSDCKINLEDVHN